MSALPSTRPRQVAAEPGTVNAWICGVLIAFFFALDQATKWLIMSRFALGEERPVIPNFFHFYYTTNTGAAFSMFSNGRVFFLILSIVTLIGLAWFAWRGAFRDRWSRIAVSLLTAGVLGNLTDRILHGHVIDFLLFDLHVPFANPWPTFNVADSCICVAVGIFIVASFQAEKNPVTPAA